MRTPSAWVPLAVVALLDWLVLSRAWASWHDRLVLVHVVALTLLALGATASTLFDIVALGLRRCSSRPGLIWSIVAVPPIVFSATRIADTHTARRVLGDAAVVVVGS